MPLSDSFTLGAQILPNRIVTSRLGRGHRAIIRRPTTSARPLSPIGLAITEPLLVDPRLIPGLSHRACLFTMTQARAWQPIIDQVHQAGGRIYAQLSHPGRLAHPHMLKADARPVAPSAIAARRQFITRDGPEPYPVPRALDISEIPEILDQFANAAILAKKAGFDGVEVQASGGFLTDQFLRSCSNRRNDDYGGSYRNRARFLLEVTETIIAIWGVNRVGVRFSPWSDCNDMADDTPYETFSYVSSALDQLGLAYLHLVEAPGHPQALTPQMRQRFGGALIISGQYTQENASRLLEEGLVDLFATEEAKLPAPPAHRIRLPKSSASTPSYQANIV